MLIINAKMLADALCAEFGNSHAGVSWETIASDLWVNQEIKDASLGPSELTFMLFVLHNAYKRHDALDLQEEMPTESDEKNRWILTFEEYKALFGNSLGEIVFTWTDIEMPTWPTKEISKAVRHRSLTYYTWMKRNISDVNKFLCLTKERNAYSQNLQSMMEFLVTIMSGTGGKISAKLRERNELIKFASVQTCWECYASLGNRQFVIV